MSASKVRWLELSQLSLCSEFDKENSMEFSLISLLLIHFTTVAMRLLSHVTLIMWPTVTCNLWRDHVWHCDKVTWYFPVLHLVVVNKKRNINNDLANLPSHDIVLLIVEVHTCTFLSLPIPLKKIPFPWALLSWHECHIKAAFLIYHNSSCFWKIELSVLHNHDDNFQLHFIDSLCLPPIVNTMWLLEGNVNTLSEIIVGLFIYSAITLRLIINCDAFSLQQQLKNILYLLMKASQTEPKT